MLTYIDRTPLAMVFSQRSPKVLVSFFYGALFFDVMERIFHGEFIYIRIDIYIYIQILYVIFFGIYIWHIWFCVILQTYKQLCSMDIFVDLLDLSTCVGNALWLVAGSRCYPSASESGMRKKMVFLHLRGDDDDDPLMMIVVVIVWGFFGDDDGWWLLVKRQSLYVKLAA